MFSKSSVFAVLALAAFACLGALLFPQVVQAQEGCVWDCDLGSDPFFNPWGNSPASQLDIAFCIDQGCVFQNLVPTLGPIPSSSTDVAIVVSDLDPLQTCTNPLSTPTGAYRNVTISGPVVAWLQNGSAIVSGSPAQASLFIKIKCATLDGAPGSGTSTVTRAVVPKELRTNVFDSSSRIEISPFSIPNSPSHPSGWTGCSNNGVVTSTCAFPLGVVEFNNSTAIAKVLPAGPAPLPYLAGEVFRADESTRFVGVRDCKGAADVTPPADPTTIECSSGSGGNQVVSTGGGQSLALLFFVGNWSGANAHTFNPTKGSNSYDIDLSTVPNAVVLQETVLASANGGSPIPPKNCSPPGQNVQRCFFDARPLNVTCQQGQHVTLLVTGELQDGRKFQSTDSQLQCSNSQ